MNCARGADESRNPNQNRMVVPARRAFYLRETVVVGFAIAVVFNIALAGSFTDDTVDPSRKDDAIWLGIALLLGFNASCLRAILARVVARNHDVVVRNVFRTHRFKWSEIDCFTIEPSGLFPLVGVLNLKSGEKRRASGLAAPNPLGRPNNRTAQKLIDELNVLLEYTRQHGGSLAGADAAVNK